MEQVSYMEEISNKPLHNDNDCWHILYTNVDQFLNKRDDMLKFIAGDEPDLIIYYC